MSPDRHDDVFLAPTLASHLRLEQLARRLSIQTTADAYGRLDDADLERPLARMEPLS